MGLFGKIFKGIGKAFKKVGKFIKKGFGKLGKFMNKLGIVGQIGMMFIMPGLANAAMSGLSALGGSFMSGLGSMAAGQGFGAGVARFAHGVIQGTGQLASKGMNVLGSITNNVVGAVTDTVRMIGNKIAPNFVNSVTAIPGATTASNQLSQIAANASQRLANVGEAVRGLGTPLKTLGDTVTGQHSPNYKEFTNPDTGKGVKLDVSVEDNMKLFEESPQYKAWQDKLSSDITPTDSQSLLADPEIKMKAPSPPTYEEFLKGQPTPVPEQEGILDRMKRGFQETYTGPNRRKLMEDIAQKKLATGFIGVPETQYGYQGGNLVARSQTYQRGRESGQIAGTDAPIPEFSSPLQDDMAPSSTFDFFDNMFATGFETPEYLKANNRVGFA